MIQELHSFENQVLVSYVQLFLTHMLSLESVLGFCHEIAKGRDCKVEFNQPSCRLYFVPNLLVFQQLETLYLGGNHVRVVCVRECEELLKCVQRSRDSRLDFVGGSRLQATKLKHTCQACQKLKRHASCSLQDKSSSWLSCLLTA